MDVEGVKVINDIQSKKSWEDLKVPEWLIEKLKYPPVNFKKPSIIQSKAINAIMNAQVKTNFIFQSSNGSGKTGAYMLPALMHIDTSIASYQILIVSHTRELNRQIF